MRPTLIFLILNLIVVSCLELSEDKWDNNLTQVCNCIECLESIENSSIPTSYISTMTFDKDGNLFFETRELLVKIEPK